MRQPRAVLADREVREIFAPEAMPLNAPADVLYRWHTQQWRRVGNYVLGLEAYIAELEARIAALEP